jgi:hypothetical protein
MGHATVAVGYIYSPLMRRGICRVGQVDEIKAKKVARERIALLLCLDIWIPLNTGT